MKRGTDTLDRYPKLRTGAAEVQVIPNPGIPDIKRVELFTKYRPLIPLQFRRFCNITIRIHQDDILSYNASERVLLKERKVKLEKDKEEAQKATKLAGD